MWIQTVYEFYYARRELCLCFRNFSPLLKLSIIVVLIKLREVFSSSVLNVNKIFKKYLIFDFMKDFSPLFAQFDKTTQKNNVN